MHENNPSGQEMEELFPDQLDGVSGGVGGAATADGSFSSNTGTQLNILVEWCVEYDATGTKNLNVTVSAQSYSLTSIAMENGVDLSVNGVIYHSSSLAVSYSGRAIKVNRLADFSIPNVGGAVHLVAVWHFNGTYGSVSLGDIRAEATVTL